MKRAIPVLFLFVAFAFGAMLFGCKQQRASAQSVTWTPVPCVTTSGGVPVSQSPNPVLTPPGCQATHSPSSPTPTPAPTPTPTPTMTPPGPLSVSPSSWNGGATSTPFAFAFTDPYNTVPVTATAPPGGCFSVSVSGTQSGNVIITTNGSMCSNQPVAITDSVNTQTVTVTLVANPTPTPTPTPTPPGPLVHSPTSKVFPAPTATPFSFTFTDPYNTTQVTATAPPGGCVTVSAAGAANGTVTVGTTGATCTPVPIAVTDGVNTTTVTAAVSPTPAPATPTPAGPLVLSTSSASFQLGGAAQTITYTDPFLLTAPTVSPTPGGIVSAGSITLTNPGTLSAAGSFQLAPVAVGTASVKVNDGTNAVQSIAASVTPTPTPTPFPSPDFTATAPGTTYPVSQTVPMTGAVTVVAQVQIQASNTNGSQIFATAPGAANLSFNSGTGSTGTNPTNGTGLKCFDGSTSPGYSASPANGLSPVASGNPAQYLMGCGLGNGYVTLFVCAIPTTVNDCVQTQTADTDVFTSGNYGSYIGAASDGTSRNATGFLQIWAVAKYPVALSLADMNRLAIASTPNPYPSSGSTPAPISTAWTNANPPPAGWYPVPDSNFPNSLVYGTANENVAPNVFAINWDQACAKISTLTCSGGEIPESTIGSGSAAIVAKTLDSVGPRLTVCNTEGILATYNSRYGTQNCQAQGSGGIGDFGYGIFFGGYNSTLTGGPASIAESMFCVSPYNTNGGAYGICNGWNTGGTGTDANGLAFSLPEYAMAQEGVDAHLWVLFEGGISSTNTTPAEIEMWRTGTGQTKPPVSGNCQSNTPAGCVPQQPETGSGTWYAGSASYGALASPWPTKPPFGPFTGSANSAEGIGNLIRPEELYSTTGVPVIPHAIGMSFPNTGAGTYLADQVYPATKSDGYSACGTAGSNDSGIMGSFYRFNDAGYAVATAAYNNGTINKYLYAILTAANKYGIYYAESSGAGSSCNQSTTYDNFLLWGSYSYLAANIDYNIKNVSGGTIANTPKSSCPTLGTNVVSNPWDCIGADTALTSTSASQTTYFYAAQTINGIPAGIIDIRPKMFAGSDGNGHTWSLSNYYLVNVACAQYIMTGQDTVTLSGTYSEKCPHT